ncbi:MAG TPA: bacillithiol biosynthesis cysteine-adding enzyme BshC, partial [Pyrinomonadaceae bacterium]|nr:bacillithiol biosynthesis cysteine-adding enzyme BshC [Pyrinomonadaceae bacterium]
MSTAETACFSTPEESGLRVETLPFDRIPQQSRLFLDYLRDPLALREFYPEAVRFHHELPGRAARVLAGYKTDRTLLCDALADMNSTWGAGEETLRNIQLLRDSDCIAVVSGQQVGLFSGPLYTIYKALSAVKLALCLSQRNTKAVPVFWMATEDHDFPEVAKAEFIARDCRLAEVEVPSALHQEGQPVGRVVIDNSIDAVLSQLLETLPISEFTPDLEAVLRDAYRPGLGYGEAFARLITALLGRHGLVLLDPLDQRLKTLAAPLYATAAARAPEIASAIEARSRRLVEAGYHAQVTATENSFPLFMHDETGARHAMTRSADGRYSTKTGEQAYTVDELSALAQAHPERFSPNVTLRAVVQDYLLPTIAYYGGAAEIAYFAQTSEVYRLLDRPITPILPRSSLTMIERHTGRLLEKYGLSLVDLFAGPDAVLARVVEEHLGAETAKSFAKVEGSVN